MCGIAGIVGFPATVEGGASEVMERRVRLMTQMLRHRGPDGGAIWTGEGASIGHRRLSIIDLSDGGRQPMCTDDGRFVLSFNGEIFNYRELRTELAARGHAFRSDSDSEVLLRACVEWGDEVTARLVGQFAFAFNDTRERRLLLARDHLGIKPLYYAVHEGALYFASEAKAIAAVLPGTRAPRLDLLGQYLSFLWIPGEDTFFSGIRKMLPGSRLVWHDGRASTTRWWDPVEQWKAAFAEAAGAGRREAGERDEEGRALLGEAVSSQLASDVPLGLLLSGGVDSTILLAEMASRARTPRAFTATYGTDSRSRDVFDDDLPFARIAAAAFGAEMTEETLEADVPTLLPEAVWHCDEPLADPTIVTNLALTRRAKPALTVLLTGMGADEILAGYPRYPAVLFGEAMRAVPAPLLRAGAGLLRLAVSSGLLPIARGRRPLQLLAHLHKPFEERFLGYSSYVSPDVLPALLEGDARATAATADVFAFHRGVLGRTEGLSPLSRLLATDLCGFLPYLNLENMDKTGMANGVELRVPFLDHRLVEWSMRLPDGDKLRRNAERKVLLRRAWSGRIPEEILRRPKTGYSPPVRGWMRETQREYARDILLSSRARERGIVSPRAVEQLFEENTRGRAEHGMQLWTLLVLETWMRVYADRTEWTPAEDPAALRRIGGEEDA